MIVSSIAEQYGIRVYSKEFKEMKWNEFKALLGGIRPNTALGRIVSIRLEDDKETLKHFTPEMRKIRNEWQRKQAKQKSQADVDSYLESIKNAFIAMAKGGD